MAEQNNINSGDSLSVEKTNEAPNNKSIFSSSVDSVDAKADSIQEKIVDEKLSDTIEKIEENTNYFSAQLFMGSVMFRQNLDDLSISQSQFLQSVYELDPASIEDKYGTFGERMLTIREDIDQILSENSLNPSDTKYAVETMALIDIALDNVTNDDMTKNINVLERFVQYTDKIQKKLKNDDKDTDLVEEADLENEKRMKYEEFMSRMNDEDFLNNDILSNPNKSLDKSQRYFEIANELKSRDIDYETALYRARRDADPSAIISLIKVNPHIFGENVTAESLVKRQMEINKERLMNSSLLNRATHSIKRELQASHSAWRDHVMTNPLAIPIKGLVLPYDAVMDKVMVSPLHDLRIKRYEALSQTLHEAGMEAGKAAVLKQAESLKKDAVSEKDVEDIKLAVKDSFNGLSNQSIIIIKSIVDDAKNGKVSPILTDPLNKIKNVYDDQLNKVKESYKNIIPENNQEIEKNTSKRKLRMGH